MGEKMTLREVLDGVLVHVDGIAPYAEVPVVDLQAWADTLTAHLTQPAQAVDVGAIVPSNWLDPMLTGPNAVIGKPPYGCQDIERVLNEVRKRLTAALPNANANGKEGS